MGNSNSKLQTHNDGKSYPNFALRQFTSVNSFSILNNPQ